METCFVIQPFDKSKFDQRYNDIFEPSIKACGLEPYRVDRDASVSIPITQIEEGIKSSKICFAEITLDNPNVWYELGYAFALNKDVVMVTEERQRFPFDIQHRHVINYQTSSKSDFEKLEMNIIEKINALLHKQSSVKKIIQNPVRDSEGLKQHEVTMLLMIMENQLTSEDTVSIYSLSNYMNNAGFNNLATSISLRELTRKGFIETFKELSNYDNQEFIACRLTVLGETWVLDNQDKIEFRNQPKIEIDNSPNDLPF